MWGMHRSVADRKFVFPACRGEPQKGPFDAGKWAIGRFGVRVALNVPECHFRLPNAVKDIC